MCVHSECNHVLSNLYGVYFNRVNRTHFERLLINIKQMEDLEQIELSNIKTLCRVCLQQPTEEELLDLQLIYDEEEDLSYGECFTVCTKIILTQPDDDSSLLPQNLCKSCGLELQMAYDFKKKVEISERFLQQVQFKHKPNASYTDLAENEDEHLVVTDEELVSQSPSAEYEYVEAETEKNEGLEYIPDHEYTESVHNQIETIETVYNEEVGETRTFTIVDCEQAIRSPTIVHSNQQQDEQDNESTEMSWQTAVVTVANESHLPITTANDEQTDVCVEIYQSDENTQDAAALTTTDDSTQIENARSRKRYSGKFTCNYCNKVFPNHSRMQQHRRSHEPDRPKYPCSHCERIYATKQAMMVHMQTVHTKTASYTCSICGKIYAIKKGLEVHMRYHTGTFPYECDLCDRKFAQISHLKTHKNVKHNSERFCCEHPDCGKFFTSSSSLRNHEFSHGIMPFECEFCQRGYPAKAKLKVHLKRKHGQDLSLEELERMRKFRVIRSKLNLVKIIKSEE